MKKEKDIRKENLESKFELISMGVENTLVDLKNQENRLNEIKKLLNEIKDNKLIV